MFFLFRSFCGVKKGLPLEVVFERKRQARRQVLVEAGAACRIIELKSEASEKAWGLANQPQSKETK